MPQRKCTSLEIKLRMEIESELSAIVPLSEKARHLLYDDGFLSYFNAMRDLYPSAHLAYESLESFYETIFGRRRYSDYDSFRNVIQKKTRKSRL